MGHYVYSPVGGGLQMKKIANLVKKYWVAITLSVLAAITILSLLPLKELPPVPGTDKTHHFIAYALLMFPAALRKPKRWWLLCIGFIAYSGIIELVQPYVNRYGEWLDMAANAAGVVCGMLVAIGVNRLFRS